MENKDITLSSSKSLSLREDKPLVEDVFGRTVPLPEPGVVLSTIEVTDRSDTSLWDVMIPVGSRTPVRRTLYSEDSNAGQSHDGVWVNPKREGAEA